jgi:hypothetical protein
MFYVLIVNINLLFVYYAQMIDVVFTFTTQSILWFLFKVKGNFAYRAY